MQCNVMLVAERLTLSPLCTQVMVVNPGFIKYVHHIWLDRKGYYPSTGFVGVMLAMHICDEVSHI